MSPQTKAGASELSTEIKRAFSSLSAAKSNPMNRRGSFGPTVGITRLIPLLIVLFPFLWMLQMSFKENKDLYAFPPKLFFDPTLENYTTLFDDVFTRSFFNSLYTSLISTIVAMMFGVPAAFALSRANYKSDNRISLWILTTRMAPPIAFTLPYFLAYRYLGLMDTRLWSMTRCLN